MCIRDRVVLYLLVLPWESAYSFQGRGIYYWALYTLAINLALSVVFGFAGALLGRSIARFRGSMDQPTRY